MLRQIVILVGGRGTRLGTLTEETPKPLLPVAGKPFLNFVIQNCARHGLNNIILLAGHYGNKIEEYYTDNPIDGVSISVVIEPESLGTAGCLKFAQEYLEDIFVVSNGDSIFDFNILAMLDNTDSGNWLAKLALRRVENAERFGRVELGAGGKVCTFSEKTTNNNRPALINGGVYLLRKEITEIIQEMPSSLEMDVFPKLVKSQQLLGQEYSGFFIDIGVPESYELAQTAVPLQQKRPAVFFDRDGTLNQDDGYTHKPDDLQWIEGAPEAIRRCNDKGYYVFVVTNQAGIARGLYDEEDLHRFHRHMQQKLQPFGAHIDALYHCPHHPNGDVKKYSILCDCRKPAAGMLREAAEIWPIDKAASFLIGDSKSDMDAAEAFGIEGYAYKSGDLDVFVREILEERNATNI